jgi:hypothetical protein
MTNIFGSEKKVRLKHRLFEIGVEALEKEGWKVSRIPGSGKSSLRRITRGSESLDVSIRTTQDTWIAFPRASDDKSWRTLSEVDAVVAVSVDDVENPRHVLVHMLDGDEMRDRFDRAYRARRKAGHTIPVGRGVWVALYHDEANDPPRLVGAGAGVKHPAFARVPLRPQDLGTGLRPAESGDSEGNDDGEGQPARAGGGPRQPSVTLASASDGGEALTIPEAKRRLAASLGVDPSNIKITVEA